MRVEAGRGGAADVGATISELIGASRGLLKWFEGSRGGATPSWTLPLIFSPLGHFLIRSTSFLPPHLRPLLLPAQLPHLLVPLDFNSAVRSIRATSKAALLPFALLPCRSAPRHVRHDHHVPVLDRTRARSPSAPT
jgi:hypothetical protein